MAWSSYTNFDVRHNENLAPIVGRFKETEFGFDFEYTLRIEDEWLSRSEFPHKVFVGPHGETRYARVLKTVAYIVTDEGEGGFPVVEKWVIKGHRVYDKK